MTRKKGTSSGRANPAARGVAAVGRETHPQANVKDSELVRERRPASAPVHGTPLAAKHLDRLKEEAKWSPVSHGAASQEDPSSKK